MGQCSLDHSPSGQGHSGNSCAHFSRVSALSCRKVRYSSSELAHIALDHRNVLWILLTVPARIIPFYQSLMFRAMCYSADRVAAALVGTKEAINAITVLSNSPDISAEFNREAYRSDIMEKKPWIDNAARIYYNFISDTPIPAYRIAALLNSEKESDVLS